MINLVYMYILETLALITSYIFTLLRMHVVTVDELSYRLSRAKVANRKRRQEKAMTENHPFQKKQSSFKSPQRALQYFNKSLCLDLNIPYNISDDKAACALWDLSNIPLEVVRAKLDEEEYIRLSKLVSSRGEVLRLEVR